MARRPHVTVLDEFINLSIDIDSRLYQRQKTKKNSRPHVAVRSAMEIDPPVPSRPALGKGPQHLTRNERQRRAQEQLCYYCGKPGHIASSCPAKRQVNALLFDPQEHAAPNPIVNATVFQGSKEKSLPLQVVPLDTPSGVQSSYFLIFFIFLILKTFYLE